MWTNTTLTKERKTTANIGFCAIEADGNSFNFCTPILP